MTGSVTSFSTEQGSKSILSTDRETEAWKNVGIQSWSYSLGKAGLDSFKVHSDVLDHVLDHCVLAQAMLGVW